MLCILISDGVGIEARLQAELIQPKIIRYLTDFEEKWSRVLQSWPYFGPPTKENVLCVRLKIESFIVTQYHRSRAWDACAPNEFWCF